MHSLDRKHSILRWLGFILWIIGAVLSGLGILYFIFDTLPLWISIGSFTTALICVVLAATEKTYLYHWIWEED
ncbi:MAG: hypothetical protein KA052_03310 [Candidatus Pacebacteria bacterium]|nr:hypothetical protein [Candidatus Paceibacterota bacterium]